MGFGYLIQNNCRKWNALTPAERIILIQALMLLPVVRIVRWMCFERIQGVLRGQQMRFRQTADGDAMVLEKARQTARMVTIAAAHSLFRPSCLDRSFLLWAMLRRRGIESDLFLGVRKDEEKFEAHAWVEINGVVLNDMDDVRKRFLPFPMPITGVVAYPHRVGVGV